MTAPQAPPPLLCLILNHTAGIVPLKTQPHLLWDESYQWPERESGPPRLSSCQSPGSLRHPVEIVASSPQRSPAPCLSGAAAAGPGGDGWCTCGSARFSPDPGTGRVALMTLWLMGTFPDRIPSRGLNCASTRWIGRQIIQREEKKRQRSPASVGWFMDIFRTLQTQLFSPTNTNKHPPAPPPENNSRETSRKRGQESKVSL